MLQKTSEQIASVPVQAIARRVVAACSPQNSGIAQQANAGGKDKFMSRSKTLRKTHKARKVARIGSLRIPPWWLDEYFGPIERFVEQIHTEGVVDASATGVLVHLLPDGRLYYPVAEMWRMAEVFRIAQLRDAPCPGSGLLMRVAGTLHTGQLLTPDDVDDLRRCVRALRAYAGGMAHPCRSSRRSD
ncbi:hypothetical protein [Cupriavidus sp. CuC1]|uniref:hypothetical protein n=1 Tax=Cupriavidus sp. CuC1 TaxID=3373131 RepID=UPI0037D8B36E